MRRLLAMSALAMSALAMSATLAAPTTAYAASAAPADSWEYVPPPLLAPSSGILDLEATPGDRAWIAGYQGYVCVPFMSGCLTQAYGSPVVRLRQDSEWKEYPLRGWWGESAIRDVEAHGDEVWVAGESIVPNYLGHFNGSTFEDVEGPPDGVRLLSASAAGTWAASHYRISRRQGNTWLDMTPAADMDAVYALHLLDSGVGFAAIRSETGRLFRWDGTSWQGIPIPKDQVPGYPIRQILAVSADELWLTTGSTLAHWKDDRWETVPTPNGGTAFGSMAIDADGVLWVIVHANSENQVFRLGENGLTRSGDVSFKYDTRLSIAPGTRTVWASGQNLDPYVTTRNDGPLAAVLRR